MSNQTAKKLVEQLNWRYATKHFDSSKKISIEDWTTLEKAMVLAPSSFGLQPWKFIVVKDAGLRKQLRTVSWDQAQIEEASHMVVFAVKKNLGQLEIEQYVKRIAEVRGVTVDSLNGFRDMMSGFVKNPALDVNAWASRQVYISLGMLLTSAALLEIDACPMEGFDSAKYDELLGLSGQGFHALAVVALGYRAKDDSYASLKKVRFEHKDLIVYR